jgi:hypothetical protein
MYSSIKRSLKDGYTKIAERALSRQSSSITCKSDTDRFAPINIASAPISTDNNDSEALINKNKTESAKSSSDSPRHGKLFHEETF